MVFQIVKYITIMNKDVFYFKLFHLENFQIAKLKKLPDFTVQK